MGAEKVVYGEYRKMNNHERGIAMLEYKDHLQRATDAIKNADFILIGGGAGLSDAAGLHYSGSSRRAMQRPVSVSTEQRVFRDYHQRRASIYQSRIPSGKGFCGAGRLRFIQCERGCHNTLYDNEEQVKAMIANTQDCRIPTALVPKCPVCGGEMDTNLCHSNDFVQDENWYAAKSRYENFLKTSKGKRIIYLELGIGFNTPGIIRIPFEQLCYQNKNAMLIRINRDYPDGAKENAACTIAFTEDMAQIIKALCRKIANRRGLFL